MRNAAVLEGDLVIQGGRILGRLERFGVPVVKGRRCGACGALVPVSNWDIHQYACHKVGWGHYRCPIAFFEPPVGKARPSQVDWVAELASFLK